MIRPFRYLSVAALRAGDLFPLRDVARKAVRGSAIALLIVAVGGGAGGPLLPGAQAADSAGADCPTLLRHTFNGLQTGKPQSLCDFRGKVLVIVNTASYCGYTNQYEGLEALYRKYRDRGLVVIGFPSNDFGSQEPGSNKEIAEFCRTTYGVEFPMFEKSSVARLETQPLYATLVKATGQAPQWNFHKYVVDRTGTRITSYASDVEPGRRDFVGSIERLLAERP
jgi:glutathione peroxidase